MNRSFQGTQFNPQQGRKVELSEVREEAGHSRPVDMVEGYKYKGKPGRLEKSSFEDKELNQGQGGCRKINEETTHTLGKEMMEAWRWWW